MDIFGIIYTLLLAFFGTLGILAWKAAGLVGAKAGYTSFCLLFIPFAGFGAITSNFYILCFNDRRKPYVLP